MVAKDFETGDLVWAKMKGFPPWPSEIKVPPSNAKPKKGYHYVLFYGYDNYAWIPDENIFLHNEGLVEKYTKGQKRPPKFLEAVEKIVKASKGCSKYQKLKHSEINFANVKIKEEPIETESLPSNSICIEKVKRKVPVKKEPKVPVKKGPTVPVRKISKVPVKKISKVPLKKISKGPVKKIPKGLVKKEFKVPVKKEFKVPVKKEPKKRPLPFEFDGAESSANEHPFKFVKSDDPDFSLLFALIPPNYSYDDDISISSSHHNEANISSHCDEANISSHCNEANISSHHNEANVSGHCNEANIFSHCNKNESMPQTCRLSSRKAYAYVERPSSPPINLKEVCKNLKIKNITATAKTIGFLGLGKIAQKIIKNLLHSGHSVTLWNRTLQKCDEFVKIGAKVSKTPFDVVLASDITFCCVSDSDAAKSIVFENFGVIKALEASKNKSYVEMTSLDPETALSIGDGIIARGGRYLEAPLHGSRAHANEGLLFILCSGDKSLYEDCQSCFKAIAKSSLYVGPNIGLAFTYNIIHSMLLGTIYAAIAESLSLIERIKLKKEDFLDILQHGTLNSMELINKSQSMVRAEYASYTPLKHQQKELNFGLILGSSFDQPMPITAAANEVYKYCKLLMYADHDVSAVFEGTR